MPVNVLYACHTASLTGAALSMSQLMINLDGARFRPFALFSKDGPVVEKLAAKGIPVHILKHKGFLGVRLVRQAMALIRSEAIGLVHLNSASPFTKYIGIAARLSGVPVVWHIREDPRGTRVRRLDKWINLLSQRIFVVSSDLYELFARSGNAFLIYNGVDTEEFNPGADGGMFRDKFKIPRDAFVFGMAGTIEQRKGNLLFLEAARELLKDDVRPYFVIVGSGTPEVMEEVNRFLRESPGLSERVVMTGRLTDMSSVMAAMDVLAMPSLWEGFPRALIEAMACARPAIASDVGEVKRIIEEGGTGFVVPAGDAVALAGAMRRCVEMRERLAGMGQSARAKAVSEYSIQSHVQAVCEQYEEVIRARR